MKAVVAAFNQEKALGGAFSMIVQLHKLIVSQHNDYAGPRPGSVFTSSHYTPQPDYTRLQARCGPGDLGLAASQTISIGVRGAPVPVCIMRARPFNPNPNISLEVSNFAA